MAREDINASPGVAPLCPWCRHREPQQRYTHFLALAQTDGLEGIKKHLDNASAFEHELQSGIVQWVADQMTQWAGFVDEAGVHLPWWQARQQALHRGTHPCTVAQAPRPDAAYLAVLHRAVDHLAAPPDKAWAQGWLLLAQLGVHGPGRKLEAAAFCHLMAQQYSHDADDWRHEARVFVLEAQQRAPMS